MFVNDEISIRSPHGRIIGANRCVPRGFGSAGMALSIIEMRDGVLAQQGYPGVPCHPVGDDGGYGRLSSIYGSSYTVRKVRSHVTALLRLLRPRKVGCGYYLAPLFRDLQ